MAAVFRNKCHLILASGSPRRRDFFCQLGLDFQVVCANVPEDAQTGEEPESFVQRLALAKAKAVAREHTGAAVVGADTVVVRDGQILGKPRHLDGAVTMVKSLAGQWHEVWSGFTVISPGAGATITESVCTKVRFAALAHEVCYSYGQSGDGLDKAGGYGIQSAGAFLVEEIEGSYSNVIGLPMAQLIRVLLELAIIEPA